MDVRAELDPVTKEVIRLCKTEFEFAELSPKVPINDVNPLKDPDPSEFTRAVKTADELVIDPKPNTEPEAKL